MFLGAERTSLSVFIKLRINMAVREALREKGDGYRISEEISTAMKDPLTLPRIKNASEGERAKVVEEFTQIYEALKKLDAAPLSLLVPKVPPMLDITTEEVHALLTEAFAKVIEGAEAALEELGGDPTKQQEFAEWLANECPLEAREESESRLAGLWDGLDPAKVRVNGWAFGGLYGVRDGVEFHETAADLSKAAWETKAEGTNPLYPLVGAWLTSRPIPTEPSRHPHPIVPAAFVAPMQAPLVNLPAPALLGPVTVGEASYLPAEPDAPRAAALLLTMFGRGGGNGRVPNAPHIWLEAMLDVPVDCRDGSKRETAYTIGEIVGEWLGRNLGNYRPAGSTGGQALARDLSVVHSLWVPMNDRGGGYVPVTVEVWTGWELKDRVGFAIRLPSGQVGPKVDRSLLRRLRDSAPAYCLYLSLCFEWDKYGAHKGKLTLPTQPVVLRAPGGQVLDAQGRPLTGRGNQPVYTPHDKRAVATGERELNPARNRYPDYAPYDLVPMAYPGRVVKANERVLRQRSEKALYRLQKEGIPVEQLGTVRHPRFRPMPPAPKAAALLALAGAGEDL